MRASRSLPASIAAVLLLVPGWSGEARFDPAPEGAIRVRAVPVVPDPRAPARRRLGALTFLGGVALSSDSEAFGGYSALAVRGDRFTLVSDRGTVLRLRMAGTRVLDARTARLPGGPGTGWRQEDRDAESLVLDAGAGLAWAGFERANEVWRYRVRADGRWTTERGRAPAAMAGWPDNGGAEAMARLGDGRFVLVSESARPAGDPSARVGLVFAGDPTLPGTRAFRFAYRPAAGFRPVDAAELPDGRLLVLERRFGFPNRWASRLAAVPAGAIRPGAALAGRTMAVLEPPLLSDNFEGLAVVREGAATTVWIVSDDNRKPWQRTLLLRFRVEG